MKYKKLLLTIAIPFLAQQVFAEKANCPPLELFRESAHFTKASNFMDRSHWMLFSDHFAYDGKKWAISFMTNQRQPNAETALSEGQRYFDTKVKLINPKLAQDNDPVMCSYAEENYDYVVTAVSPPYDSREE